VILWRISNHAELRGLGGLYAPGRWHTQGRQVIYFAESPSSALLEILVHFEIDRDDLPDTYQLLKVEAPDGIRVDAITLESLPEHWKDSELVTRTAGAEWLRRGETALLRVPSAIMPETWNWLLNPRHADAAHVRILTANTYDHDLRLLGKYRLRK
jgi:RES domain-containing protein